MLSRHIHRQGLFRIISLFRARTCLENARGGSIYEALINYDELPREQALAQAKEAAVALAVDAGAVRETVEIIEVEDVPLAYYPGNTNRVKVKAAGDLCGA